MSVYLLCAAQVAGPCFDVRKLGSTAKPAGLGNLQDIFTRALSKVHLPGLITRCNDYTGLELDIP